MSYRFFEDPLTARARQRLADASFAMGVQPPPLVETALVPNAAAGGGVVYLNASWAWRAIRSVCLADGCIDAFLLWAMTHELAHIQLRHIGSNRRNEAEADDLAGFVLAFFGVPLHDVARVIAREPAFACSGSHGCPIDRLTATAAGWHEATALRQQMCGA